MSVVSPATTRIHPPDPTAQQVGLLSPPRTPNTQPLRPRSRPEPRSPGSASRSSRSSQARWSPTTSLPSYSSRGHGIYPKPHPLPSPQLKTPLVAGSNALRGFELGPQPCRSNTLTTSSTSTSSVTSTTSVETTSTALSSLAWSATTASSSPLRTPTRSSRPTNPSTSSFTTHSSSCRMDHGKERNRGGTLLHLPPTTQPAVAPDLQAMRMLNWYALHTGQPHMPLEYPLARASAFEREGVEHDRRVEKREAKRRVIALDTPVPRSLHSFHDSQVSATSTRPPVSPDGPSIRVQRKDMDPLQPAFQYKTGPNARLNEMNHPRSTISPMDELEGRLTEFNRVEKGQMDEESEDEYEYDFLDVFKIFDPRTRHQVREKGYDFIPPSRTSDSDENVPPYATLDLTPGEKAPLVEEKRVEAVVEKTPVKSRILTLVSATLDPSRQTGTAGNLTPQRCPEVVMTPPRPVRPLPPIPTPLDRRSSPKSPLNVESSFIIPLSDVTPIPPFVTPKRAREPPAQRALPPVSPIPCGPRRPLESSITPLVSPAARSPIPSANRPLPTIPHPALMSPSEALAPPTPPFTRKPDVAVESCTLDRMDLSPIPLQIAQAHQVCHKRSSFLSQVRVPV